MKYKEKKREDNTINFILSYTLYNPSNINSYKCIDVINYDILLIDVYI